MALTSAPIQVFTFEYAVVSLMAAASFEAKSGGGRAQPRARSHCRFVPPLVYLYQIH